MTPDPIDIETAVGEQAAAVSERQGSGWDIRNAPKNYGWLILFQVASAAFSFGAVWLITRHLGTEGYGAIVAVIAASQVAQVLVNWTSAAVVRFGVDEFIETGKIARTFWIRSIVLTANLIVAAALSPLWFQPLADWLKLASGSFWLVMVHFAVTVIWIHVQMSLQAAKLPRAQGFLMMVERLVIFVGIFALTAAAILTQFWAIVFYIAAPAMMILLGLYQLRKYIFARFGMDRVFVRKILTYSLPLLPMSLVGYFSGSYVDAIFVTKFLSVRDLGIYSVATQMNGLALQIPTLVNALLTPFFVTLDNEKASTKVNRYFTSALPNITLAWGAICTLAAIGGYFLIPLVFRPEFSEASTPFWILLTSSVMAIPILCGYAALTHARSVTYIAAITTTLSAIVNIVLNYLLIPRFGMAGCAWATVAAYLVCSVGFAVLLRIKVKMPISWVYLSILPNLCGTLVFSLTNNALMAIIVATVLFILVIAFKWRSVGEGVDIIRRLIRPETSRNIA